MRMTEAWLISRAAVKTVTVGGVVLTTEVILMILKKVGKWIKNHIAYGPMEDFRTTKTNGKWVKGNIFEDDERVLIIHFGGVADTITEMKDNLDSDERDEEVDG